MSFSGVVASFTDGIPNAQAGNYTDYLLAKAERQAADATIEHKRQMFLERELAWVRQGPRAQRSKQKNRFERYYETAAQVFPNLKDKLIVDESQKGILPLLNLNSHQEKEEQT